MKKPTLVQMIADVQERVGVNARAYDLLKERMASQEKWLAEMYVSSRKEDPNGSVVSWQEAATLSSFFGAVALIVWALAA